MKKHFPNSLTCLNLLCGCVGIVVALRGNLHYAAYLIGLAAVFDFFDGMLARILHVQGEFGKQLDSLADVVTFGVLPGMIVFRMLGETEYFLAHANIDASLLIIVPFLIPVFSALRLAKFNIDKRQTHSFIGLPTPANAILVASLPLLLAHDRWGLEYIILTPAFLLSLSLISSFLLVAPFSLFSLKFSSWSWKENRVRYLFLAGAVALMLSLRYAGIPLTIIWYVVLSLLYNVLNKPSP